MQKQTGYKSNSSAIFIVPVRPLLCLLGSDPKWPIISADWQISTKVTYINREVGICNLSMATGYCQANKWDEREIRCVFLFFSGKRYFSLNSFVDCLRSTNDFFFKGYAVNLMKLLQAVQQFVQVYVMNIHKTPVCVRMCVCV